MPSYYAIRWPVGGYGETPSDIAENNTLRDPAFHGRAPFYATVQDVNSLAIVGTQGTMDQEIAFANAMGLTGWSFLRYINIDAGGLGETAVARFKASTSKGALKFVSMEQDGSLGSSASYTTLAPRLIAEMGLSYYGRVTVAAVSRPLLLYFYEPSTIAATYGSLAGFKTVLDWVRAEAIAAGRGNPYIVICYWDAVVAASVRTTVAADAISSYVPLRPYDLNGPYASVRTAAQAHWAAQLATGAKMMPTAITGWSPAPRLRRPVPWEAAGQKSWVGHDRVFAFPTDAQLAAHMGEAKAFLSANAAACEASTMLIYAWEEFGEAGRVLCPSRENPTGTWIDDLAAVLT
jgi:hypothetical protein